ncbi:MAG: hypothetical protein WDO69_30185 [Pseudomonadota bacterium]
MSLRRLSLLLALPTLVGISLSACGTEDDSAPGPAGGSGATAGSAGNPETAGKGGSGAEAGTDAEGGMAGSEPGPGGSGGSAGEPSDAGSGGEAGSLTGGTGGKGGGGTGGTAGTGGKGGAGGASGTAGTGGGACHTDIQNFNTDPAGGMGRYLADTATGSVTNSTVVYSSLQGAAAPGSGQLNATFGAYGDAVQLGLFLNGKVWTCTTKLHAMVKLVATPDLSHIAGINFSVSSNNYGTYSAKMVSTTGFALDTWTPIALDLTTVTPVPKFTDISGIGFQLVAVSSGPTPVTTTMYVDDVWVE